MNAKTDPAAASGTTMGRGPLGHPLFPYHLGRTVEWGNWGITFLKRQPDERLNFGVIVGTVSFPVGAAGPVDGTYGSDRRKSFQAACDEWVTNGKEPRWVRACRA